MKLANLDSLRAIAALVVVFFHLHVEHPGVLPELASFGWVGVDLFFVISGAVIAFSAETLSDEMKSNWKWAFAVRRFSRVYPLFFVSSIVFVAVYADFWRQPSSQIAMQLVTHVTMTHSFFPITFQGMNHVSWSLGIELQYYLLIALIIAQIRRAPVMVIVTVALLIAYAWNGHVRRAVPGDGPLTHFYLSQLPGRIDEFAWGIVIWRMWKTETLRKFVELNHWIRSGISALTIIVGILVFQSWVEGVSGHSSALATFGLSVHTALGDAGTRLMIGAICGLVVFGTTLLPEYRLLIPFESLGKISYGLYLWHPIAIIVTTRFLKHDTVSALLAALVLTLELSAVSWVVLEIPSRRWLSQRLLAY